MSALKNLLKSDTPSSTSDAPDTSGKLAGQGSHFPESGGSTAAAGSTSGGPTSDLSQVTGSKDGSGQAAVGQTTTYSSQQLASGDPTGSVVDHQSPDPLTYKHPEAGSHTTADSTGVPPSAASAAATAAWEKSERMPGEFPTAGYENPYKASHALDPRVDGGKTQPTPSSTSNTTSGVASGAGVGALTGGASQATSSGSAHESTGPAPSTLTTTADPTDRSAEYSRSTDLKGLGSDPPTSTGTTQQPDETQNQSFIGKALGAVGLGGAAGAAASALGYGGNKEAATAEPHDTTALATQPGQTSTETGPPKHYRRESIPTSAYPAGEKSPAAIAAPVGGTQPIQPTASHTDSSGQQLGRDTAIGAGIGSGTVAASQLDTDRNLSQDTAGERGYTAPQASGLGLGSTTSGPVPEHPTGGTVHDQLTTPQTADESHTGRNVAAAGLATTAIGTGAYAAHEHGTRDVIDPTQTQSTSGTTTLPDRSRDIPPTEAVAAAPSRYEQQTAVPTSGTTTSALGTEPVRKEEEDHSTRNTALGAGAGAAAAGGAAYAYSQHQKDEEAAAARKAAEQHEKDLAKQQKEAAQAEKDHQKAVEKENKNAQKEAEKAEKQHQKEAEKAEKQHQKEIEKEEKKHQKEVEKEEKHQQKELEKEEKEREAAALAAKKREDARRAAEDEDRSRREREAAAGVATGTAVGAVGGGAVYAHEQQQGLQPNEPGYDASRASGEQRQTATGAAAGTDPRHSTDTKHSEKQKEKKPSIFKRIFKRRKNKDTGEDEDYSTDDEEDKGRHAGAIGAGAGAGTAAAASQAHHDDTTTTSTGSSVPHHASNTKGRNVLGHAPETNEAGLPVEPTTGQPFDPAKDPEAARRLGYEPETSASGTSATTGVDLPPAAQEPFGEITDHRR